MAKKKYYIALNEGANSFTDPTSLFKVSGNQIKSMGSTMKNSFFIRRALRNGHLKEVSEAEFIKYEEANKKTDKANKTNSDKAEYIENLKTQLTDMADEKDTLIKRNVYLEKENTELKEELEELKADSDDDSVDFDSKSIKEIKDYLKETYELSDEEVSKMESLNKAPLIDFANEIVAEYEGE